LVIFFASLSYVKAAPASDSSDPCIKVRIALDIGSGSTKAQSGIVDVCTQTYLGTVAKLKSIPLQFKENLNRPGSDKNFSVEILDQAESKISEAVSKLASDTHQALLNQPEWSEYKALAESQFEVSGAATEAFRQAGNTAEFVRRMSQHHVQVNVLSQQDEGRIGFISAMVKLSSRHVSPSQMISWDIGGGSLQMVHYNGRGVDHPVWNDFGNRLASNPMREYVVAEIKKQPLFEGKKATSPNPLIGPETDTLRLYTQSKSFVREQMSSLLEAQWLQPLLKQEDPAQVFGIGGVHQATLSLLRKLPGYERAARYSVADLSKLLDAIAVASDQELHEKFGIDEAFTSGSVTNVLLIYNVMLVTGIESVEVLDVDNTQGVMVSPRFWPALSQHLQVHTESQVSP
jgi:exopolyphosphatase/guanosine-5'-triphosphate,3'-diphosphate pyrophosphatase